MNSPLQRLRDLLPFAQPASPAAVDADGRGLSASLAGMTPVAVIARLGSVTLPAAQNEANLHKRYKRLEEIRAVAEQALPAVEAGIMAAPLPMPVEVTGSAIHADNLLKALAQAFAALAQAVAEQQHPGAPGPLFNRAIHRALALLGRRQLLAYRAYAQPSPNSWLMLHSLYLLACDPKAQALTADNAPVEHEYLGALLFAYLEPPRLPHNDLDLIHNCTRALAPYAMVSDATADALTRRVPDACFLVRPDLANCGYPLTRTPNGTSLFGALIVDCTQALAALDRNLTRQADQTVEPALDAPPALLQNLRVALGGKSARRFSRTRFRPRGDLIGGLAQVIHFLDGHVFSRRSLDCGLRQDPQALQPSEWSLIDESPDGFLLRYIRGDKWQAGVGDVVALQPRESSRTHVCLVRRVVSRQTRLEIGLQLLSPQVSVAQVARRGQTPEKALFLHSLPAYGKFGGLITRPGLLQPGQAVSVDYGGQSLTRIVGAQLEANDGLCFFALHNPPPAG